ncbi:hypothetical protein ACTXT7_012079 [Hymenolepis weldensis]
MMKSVKFNPAPPAQKRLTKCPVYSSIAIIVSVVLTIIILAACYGVSQNQPTRNSKPFVKSS